MNYKNFFYILIPLLTVDLFSWNTVPDRVPFPVEVIMMEQELSILMHFEGLSELEEWMEKEWKGSWRIWDKAKGSEYIFLIREHVSAIPAEDVIVYKRGAGRWYRVGFLDLLLAKQYQINDFPDYVSVNDATSMREVTRFYKKGSTVSTDKTKD